MVAHLDAVTSLAIDTNGLYLISGSESLREKIKNALFNLSFSLQAMIAVSDYGTWRQKRVFRRLRLIGKSSMKAYSTWPSTPQDLI